MNAPEAHPQESSPDSGRIGSRRLWVLLGVAVLAAAGWTVWNPAWGARQSAVRAMTHANLRSIARAAEVYQQQFGTQPTLDDVLAKGLLDAERLDGFSRCDPVPGGAAVLDAWLVQTKPCRAVRKGEAWGGPGETIDRDLPACRYVLMRDWSVRQIDEPEFQSVAAPRVRLTPVR